MVQNSLFTGSHQNDHNLKGSLAYGTSSLGDRSRVVVLQWRTRFKTQCIVWCALSLTIRDTRQYDGTKD